MSGTLQQGRGLQWLNGESGGTITITQAPKDTPDQAPIRVAAAPPPEVVFDVRQPARRRMCGPQPTSASSLARHGSGNFSKPHSRVYGTDSTVPVEFTTNYLPGTRVLEVKFAAPLQRFTPVTLELQDGIAGTDKQALAPWTLTFETGS